MSKIRVLICDDSALMRTMLTGILASEEDIEIVGVARNGKEGVALAQSHRPDVITMDIEMPLMTGLEALTEIMATVPTPVVMVSSLTSDGAEETLKALSIGAFDFICKPKGGSPPAIRLASRELLEKIRAAKGARVRGAVSHAAVEEKKVLPILRNKIGHLAGKTVVVASSTGGPRALTTLFETLPKSFPAAILIAQHMPPAFTGSLAKRLDAIGTVPCVEFAEGMQIESGKAYLAPGGQHLVFGPGGVAHLSQEPPVHGVRPAADLLFASAAEHLGAKAIAVVLTGMGRDGAAGALSIQKHGGIVLAESEESCAVYGMPRAAVQLGCVSAQVPIDKMARAICKVFDAEGLHAA